MFYFKRQQHSRPLFGIIVLLFFLFLFSVSKVYGDNLTSPSFQVENPTTVDGSGKSTSSSFQLLSSLGEFVIGESTSGSFTGRLGFLYFPTATSAVLSADPLDGEVDLSWTASVSTHANITHYSVGVSTSIGGTYIYTPVGNVSSYTVTSLTNGVTYYFKVRSHADGIVLAVSNTVSSTPVGDAPPGGGSGGGGSSSDPDDDEVFPYVPGKNCKLADFNCDGFVNILDLSILLYYQSKTGSVISFYDLNKDGRVGFADASIMFYYWDL